jgi:branched-chain amino acid transport system substrate-binding protein
MNTRKWLMALALVVLSAMAQAQDFKGPIRIGIVGPFSGRSADSGNRLANAVRMAIDEQNAAGGLLGAQIEAVISDDEGVPEKSTLVAQRLVDDMAVLGVIGPMNSGAVLAAGSIYERGRLPFITPAATNPRVTEQGWKAAFRLAGRDDREGPGSAVFIADVIKPKKVVLISDKTAFEAGIVKEVDRVLKERGIATDIQEVSADDRDLAPLISSIKASQADFVYIGMTGPQAALFLKQAAQAGTKIRGLGNGSLRERETFIKAAGGEAEGIYVSYNAQDPRIVPQAQDFITKFRAKYNASVSAYEPQAYDAANILLGAIKAAGVKGGKINRADVLAALKVQKNYNGAVGIPITFDDKGDIAAAPVNIFQVKGDDFGFVKAVTLQ